MNEIIINIDNIKDEELTEVIKIYNLLFIDSKDELILDKHHNTYYFLHEYSTEEIYNKFGVNIDDYTPFIIYKEYIKEYPLVTDMTLYENLYYMINLDLNDESKTFIPLKEATKIIKDSMYDNPRNADKTLRMIDVLNKLALNVDKC